MSASTIGRSQIGKFEILSRISRGGMAEVYRARRRGIGGFEKVVALKRIRADRAADPEFVCMFLDEARLAANLNHPNVVQIFEIDEVDGAPYIAMEYVKGPSLALLAPRARAVGRAAPALFARIIADVCAGLHHAHTARGPADEPLGLVHRDVSPQNIVVSCDGVAKLLDFGVAKARGRLTHSRAGTLKGKLRYLSPEQLEGAVDPRADVFAAGVCLFEATTGENPFGPEDAEEANILHTIARGCYARPSDLVPGYPPALEEIVMWAIAPDLARRCPTAQALHDALATWIAQAETRANSRELAAWIEALFPELGGPCREIDRDLATAPVAVSESVSTSMSMTGQRREEPSWVRAGRETVADGGSSLLSARDLGPGAGAASFAAGRVAIAGWLVALAIATAAVLLPRSSHAPGVTVASPPAVGLAPASGVPRDRPLPPIMKASLPTDRAPADRAPMVALARAEGDRPVASGRAMAMAVPAARRAAIHLPRPSAARAAAPDGLLPIAPELVAPVPAVVAGPAPAEVVTPARIEVPRAPSLAEASAPPIFSTPPRSPIPRPNLPKVVAIERPQDLARALAVIEQAAIAAGCSPEFAHGITAGLARLVRAGADTQIYPAGIYYFILREAALGRDKQAAQRELADAHTTGIVRALARLPVDDRRSL
jgi:serine/threonine protein kinase